MCYDMNCKYQKSNGECNRPGGRYPADSVCMMENTWKDPMDLIDERNEKKTEENNAWKLPRILWT